ncbi:hypothetical protein GCM10027275_03710 [Rhabdobacter roseus]|uniref:Outer membrane protein OmpA-like peptidoglycan-associated protein n=1 Tax=Rhabdobacter roseus TaxID=1655419 RepID=A0A840TR84_9BACT|nr:outer membrane protein OmpA-like peptidoglycan-associated protein [Rhabdobacter roseus]
MVQSSCIQRVLRGGLLLLLILGSTLTHAQSDGTRQQADRAFYSKAYAQAASDYSQLLLNNALSSNDRQDILFNLGYAYMELGDHQKAEHSFRQLLELGEPTERHRQAYLYFAQALGSNGKLQEAQAMYALYEEFKTSPETLPGFTNPAPGSASVTYRVENLSINSTNAEFSPAYFRDGLVYVAGKGTGSSSTSTNKGFLDLYYVPSRHDLSAVGVLGPDGKEVPVAKPTASSRHNTRVLGRDNYTRPTANDSRTTGTYAPFDFAAGLNNQPSQSTSGKGSSAQEFSKDLNTRYHEGPVTFSDDGSRIIFTRNNYNEGKSSKSTDNVNKLKLYSADLRDGGWANVQELPFSNDQYSTGHPSLSRDGKLLYFASDRPGGLGGTDLYVAQWDNGRWSAPLNLGPEINSKGDEMFPFVDENGHLYFASNGRRPSLGGLDIYFAELANGTITKRVSHLPAPLNSSKDDFGLITDGNRTTGYLSSNRLRGDDDIFRFVRETSLYGCRNLTLRIFEEQSNIPLDSVTITVKARGEGREEQELYTNANGEINICLEANNDFLFELSLDGYVSGILGFSTKGLTDDKPTRLEASLLKFMTSTDTDLAAPARMSTGLNDTEDDSDTPPTKPTLRGTVTSESDKTPIESVKLILKNECDGSIKQTVTGPNGRFQFELLEGCDYTLVASKSQYGTYTSAIKKIPVKSEPKFVSADLKMLKVGDVVTLDKIHYDSGKWEIRPEAARELDKMVATMRKYPSLRVEIGAHTDSQGNAEFNQYLSERRAKAALNYLASKGITRSRLTAKGYGESALLNQCKDGVLCTEEEHQRNRRTEFKVLFIR